MPTEPRTRVVPVARTRLWSAAVVAFGAVTYVCVDPANADDRVDAGEVELAIDWVRDSDDESGWESSIDIGVTETLQIGLGGSTVRDTSEEPGERINGAQLEISWWPLYFPHDLSAGGEVNFSTGTKSAPNEREVRLGLKWEPGQFKYQWDVGYEYSRSSEERESNWQTSVSVETDLTDTVELTLELAKQPDEKPALTAAFEYDMFENWKLKFSIGRQDNNTFRSVGIEYAF